MREQERNNDEIYAKVIRAGRRTYFIDVKETKAGDYYLTITESKKFTNEDGSFHFRKHKIYLYKEDFSEFQQALLDASEFIIQEKGEDVISETNSEDNIERNSTSQKFSDISFEDI